jgi:tetratricopeptide (TPR) repeat protein
VIDKELARINLARDLAESGQYAKALELSEDPLCENPNHVGWLMLNVFCLEKAGKIGIAYHLCKRLLELAPRDSSAWLNMTNLHSRLWMVSEAIKSAKRGLEFAFKEKDRLHLLVNLGCIYVDTGQFDKGLECLNKAAEIDPEADKVISNSGFCYLAKREWAKGWKFYHRSLGDPSKGAWRERIVYGKEPEWDGSPDKTVVLYGEQGVGDQICFASVVADAAKHSKKVILDVHPKLKGLFARSFPDVTVYGTHKQGAKPWKVEDRDFDASFPMGQLGEFYRLTDESWPKTPYLVADPDRVLMWKALFGTKGKPVIGIGWTGGIPRTGRRFRVSTLEDWLPLFKAIDAHWVSLEYKPSRDVQEFKEAHPEIDIAEYPFATLSEDYDDTAAMVKAMDLVVTVPTTANHLAGALGVPNIWLKHSYPCWKVAAGMPFHALTEMVEWRGTWKATVLDAIEPARSTLGMTPGNPSRTTSCATASNLEPVARSA